MKILVIGASKDAENISNAIVQYKTQYPYIDFFELTIDNQKWKDEFIIKLSESDAVLYFCSTYSCLSDNVKWEIHNIKATNKKLLVEILPSDDSKNRVNNRSKVFQQIEQLVNEKKITISNQDFLNKDNKKYLMDQYKLMLQTSETLLDRRQKISGLYISISSIVLPVVGVLLANANYYLSLVAAVLSIIVAIVNFSWIRIIHLYGDLNYAKFEVIQEIEKQFPVKLFASEWQIRNRKANDAGGKNPVSFTKLEKKLPQLFITIYLIIAACSIMMFIFRVMQIIIF